MMNAFLYDIPRLTIMLDSSVEPQIKQVCKDPDFTLTKLREANLSNEDWDKISSILANPKLNNDLFFHQFMADVENFVEKPLYSMIIKAIAMLFEKVQNSDRINLMFDAAPDSDLRTKISKYEALCVFDLNNSTDTAIAYADFVKDTRSKKKTIKTALWNNPEIDAAYLFSEKPEYKVLIRNKIAELYVRSHIMQEILKVIYSKNDIVDIDTKTLMLKFNEIYEEALRNTTIFNDVLLVEYRNTI